VFLACDDPYRTARLMTEQLGWRPGFASTHVMLPLAW
jgi:hypothetical protein